MRKLILILGFLIVSCSNDSESSEIIYNIKVDSGCPKTNVTTTATYRVSKDTYDRVGKDYSLGTSCYFATFNDENLISRKGYVVNMSECNSCK